MQQKIGHTSSCDVSKQRLQQECYEHHISEIKDGYSTWNQKSLSAQRKLRANLQERWNMKSKLEIFTKELSTMEMTLSNFNSNACLKTNKKSSVVSKTTGQSGNIDDSLKTGGQTVRNIEIPKGTQSKHTPLKVYQDIDQEKESSKTHSIKETIYNNIKGSNTVIGPLFQKSISESLLEQTSKEDVLPVNIIKSGRELLNEDLSEKSWYSNGDKNLDLVEQSTENITRIGHQFTPPIWPTDRGKQLIDVNSYKYFCNVSTQTNLAENGLGIYREGVQFPQHEHTLMLPEMTNFASDALRTCGKRNDFSNKHHHHLHALPELDSKMYQHSKSANNYLNIHMKMKEKENLSSHNVYSMNTNMLPMSGNVPSFHHQNSSENIYQKMATNSDYHNYKMATSAEKICKTKSGKFPNSMHHIVYHCKDLDRILSQYKKDRKILQLKNSQRIRDDKIYPVFRKFESIEKANEQLIKKGASYMMCGSKYIQRSITNCDLRSDIYFRKDKSVTTNNKNHSKSILNKNNGLPFSFCNDGSTWNKQTAKFTGTAVSKPSLLSKYAVASDATQAQDVNNETVTSADSSIVVERCEGQRVTPISVRIIRRLADEANSVNTKLAPIVQKSKVRHLIRYPISPKYRKPRNYCSAFMRKKPVKLKQLYNAT